MTLLLRSTLILYDLCNEIFKTGKWGVTESMTGFRVKKALSLERFEIASKSKVK